MSIEYEKLKAEALPLGLFVGIHREWKSGPYFVSVMGDQKAQLAKFATAAEVRALLAEYKRGKSVAPLPQTPEDEYTALKNKATLLGLHVGQHKTYDVCRGGGYFLVPKRRHKDEPLQPTLLKYATAEQVNEYLNREADNYAA